MNLVIFDHASPFHSLSLQLSPCVCVYVCVSWRVEQCVVSEVRHGEEKIVNRDDDNPASKASQQLLITRKQTMD